MAVYTPVSADELAAFLADYAVGEATSFKGIAEGVENSNFMVDTASGRYFLTLYEKRVEAADLPWFLALTTHLADKGLPVPRPIRDRTGQTLRQLNGRPACLIEFLPGVSVTEPTPAQCGAVGAALGRLHSAAADFTAVRANALGPSAWPVLAARCGDQLGRIDPDLPGLVAAGLAATQAWPAGLPSGVIHADLFCDNVLMLDGEVSGLIDFYFACTDLIAYDLAVTHAAWCFTTDGSRHVPERAAALWTGYAGARGLSAAEVAALPLLGVGAALRFTLTRAYDWLNTPPDALVTRKDPMAFARRLRWYLAATPEMMAPEMLRGA
ncbi:homoserine kinase [Sandarakinorhabdus rubra]|uniref:homoserine kinase n=1 Tax=Sandarakinorhabdus rubra TaxID=2672568 RepID=UPI0013DB1480|nr:homoserine kinase [Sandarakinorhabdus rubra]